MKPIRHVVLALAFAGALSIIPTLAFAEEIDSGNKPFFASIKDMNGARITAWVLDSRVPQPIPADLDQSEVRDYLEDRKNHLSTEPLLVTIRAPRHALRGMMLYPGRTIGIIGVYEEESREIRAESVFGSSWSMVPLLRIK